MLRAAQPRRPLLPFLLLLGACSPDDELRQGPDTGQVQGEDVYGDRCEEAARAPLGDLPVDEWPEGLAAAMSAYEGLAGSWDATGTCGRSDWADLSFVLAMSTTWTTIEWVQDRSDCDALALAHLRFETPALQMGDRTVTFDADVPVWLGTQWLLVGHYSGVLDTLLYAEEHPNVAGEARQEILIRVGSTERIALQWLERYGSVEYGGDCELDARVPAAR